MTGYVCTNNTVTMASANAPACCAAPSFSHENTANLLISGTAVAVSIFLAIFGLSLDLGIILCVIIPIIIIVGARYFHG